MIDIPQVTLQHLYDLMTAEHERPVLYVKHGPDDDGDGPLELDVWAAAYVHHDRIVLTQADAADFFGSSNPTDQDMLDHLPSLQVQVDEVCDNV